MNNIFTLCMVNSIISGTGFSTTLVQTIIFIDIPIFLQIPADKRCIIIRTVIDDNNLKILIRLFT